MPPKCTLVSLFVFDCLKYDETSLVLIDHLNHYRGKIGCLLFWIVKCCANCYFHDVIRCQKVKLAEAMKCWLFIHRDRRDLSMSEKNRRWMSTDLIQNIYLLNFYFYFIWNCHASNMVSSVYLWQFIFWSLTVQCQ